MKIIVGILEEAGEGMVDWEVGDRKEVGNGEKMVHGEEVGDREEMVRRHRGSREFNAGIVQCWAYFNMLPMLYLNICIWIYFNMLYR